MMEIRVVSKEDAETLLQPNCPFCSLPLDWGNGGFQHVTGFVERGECGTRWCPDFKGGAGIDRSKACEHIARLRAFAKNVADNYDHDEDAHRYNTPCRVCEAERALRSGEKEGGEGCLQSTGF